MPAKRRTGPKKDLDSTLVGFFGWVKSARESRIIPPCPHVEEMEQSLDAMRTLANGLWEKVYAKDPEYILLLSNLLWDPYESMQGNAVHRMETALGALQERRGKWYRPLAMPREDVWEEHYWLRFLIGEMRSHLERHPLPQVVRMFRSYFGTLADAALGSPGRVLFPAGGSFWQNQDDYTAWASESEHHFWEMVLRVGTCWRTSGEILAQIPRDEFLRLLAECENSENSSHQVAGSILLTLCSAPPLHPSQRQPVMEESSINRIEQYVSKYRQRTFEKCAEAWRKEFGVNPMG